MRTLTLKGFLKSYIIHLSDTHTCSICKLVKELQTNPRLKEPLLLYAYFTKIPDRMIENNSDFYNEYQNLEKRLGKNREETSSLLKQIEALSETYQKLISSYLYEKSKTIHDNATKLLMREKILELKREKGISNYRIQKDLGINYGNMNDFLKHGTVNKLSLKNVRKILEYVKNY